MLPHWNNLSVLPPPVHMFLCVQKVDISTLKHVCNTIIKVLSKQSPLHREGALCSRFLYKYDRKFSHDIGYRNFRKVHTALKKYLKLNFLRDVDNFQMALPLETDDEKYLPTKQMLEYLMLRIITFSMIMLRICVCSKQAAIFYLDRIQRGESHWMCLLPYALLSRLWSIAMVLVQHSTSWYSNLYPYLQKLDQKGLSFLPTDYHLPEDLECWLDLKNIDNFGRVHWNQKSLVQVDNILLDDENDLFDNILNFVNQTTKNESDEVDDELNLIFDKANDQLSSKIIPKNINRGVIIPKTNFKIDHAEVLSRDNFKKDQGVALSRESFKILITPNPITAVERNDLQEKNAFSEHCKQNTGFSVNENVTNKNKHHSHHNVTNAVSLKKFINKEETYRNNNDSSSLTGHLSFMQWHALKKALLKLCDPITNRKIERKFQKIWQERCLNYK